MHLDTLRGRVDEQTTLLALTIVLSEWEAQFDHDQERSEDYLLGIDYVLDKIDMETVKTVMHDYDELLIALHSTLFFEEDVFEAMFVGFKNKDLYLIAFYRFEYIDEGQGLYFIKYTYDGYDALYYILGWEDFDTSEYFIEHYEQVKAVNNDHDAIHDGADIYRERVYVTHAALLRNAKSQTWISKIVLNLVHARQTIYNSHKAGRINKVTFYEYIEMLHKRPDFVFTLEDNAKRSNIDMQMAPTRSAFDDIVKKSEFLTKEDGDVDLKWRDDKVTDYTNRLGNMLKVYVGRPGMADVSQTMQQQIITLTIDNVDKLWNYRLTPFPLDNRVLAYNNLNVAFDIAFSGINPTSAPGVKRVKTSGDMSTMTKGQRIAITQLVVDVKKGLKGLM